ncbi:MAG: hypothetical protein V8K32_08025 [Candidatus Electrothrix gigas]
MSTLNAFFQPKDVPLVFHERGMLIGSYTLYPEDTRFTRSTQESQEEILQRLVQTKVDWIETDDPEKLQAELHN